MKRTHAILPALLTGLLLAAGPAASQRAAAATLIDPLVADVWVDKGENAVYRVGDPVAVYFRASEDCYMVIYDIDTDGRTRILFPQYPDDGFVYGGRTYRLPDYYNRFALMVHGPRGVEYIRAVASLTPRAFRYHTFHQAYLLRNEYITGDPFEGMNLVDAGLIGDEDLHAAATTQFFVEGYVWYPRYICGNCHAPAPAGFDPYGSVCSRYQVVAVHQYDYWWGYDYRPAVVRFRFGGPFWRWEIRSGYFFRHRPHVEWCGIGLGYMNFFSSAPLHRAYVERPRTEVRFRDYSRFEREYTPGTITYDRLRPGRVRDARTPASGGNEDAFRNRSTERTRIDGTESRDRSRNPVVVPEGRNIDTRTVEPSRNDSRGRIQPTDDRATVRVQSDAGPTGGGRTRSGYQPPEYNRSDQARVSGSGREPARIRSAQPPAADRTLNTGRARGQGSVPVTGRAKESLRQPASEAPRDRSGSDRGRER